MSRCETCSFELWLPITKLSVSALGLYNDGRFPGRCILSLDRHYDHLDDLSPELARLFMDDVARAGKAIRQLGAERINYAILGNTESHVHAHLIPRYAEDPIPTRPIWEHPEKTFKMPASEVKNTMERIWDNLGQISSKT